MSWMPKHIPRSWTRLGPQVKRESSGYAQLASLLLPVLLLLSWLGPLFWLLNPHQRFNQDWDNHCWYLACQAKALETSGQLTDTLQTTTHIGIPSPVFYGTLLYPLLAPLAGLVGSALSLRIAIVVATGLQGWLLWRAGNQVFRHPYLAAALVASQLCAVYTMTDLYNRSAIPELIALAWLGCAASLFISALAAKGDPSKGRSFWFSGVFLVLALGTHIPTCVFAALILGVSLLVVLPFCWRNLSAYISWRLWLLLALGLVVMSPWIQAVCLIGPHTRIATTAPDLFYFPERCDSLAGRLLPLGHDLESSLQGTAGQQTPWLDAPIAIAFPLLAFALLLVVWRQGAGSVGSSQSQSTDKLLSWLPWLFGGLASCLFVFSYIPPLGAFLGPLIPSIQFSYRMVGPINLLLACVVLSLGLHPRFRACWFAAKASKGSNWLLSVMIGLSFLLAAWTLPLKLARACLPPPDHKRDVIGMPHPSYADLQNPFFPDGGVNDYVNVDRWRALTEDEHSRLLDLRFELETPLSHAKGGPQVREARLAITETSWVRTNALAFDWGVILVDGFAVPRYRMAVAEECFIAVQLEPGQHRVEWVWMPPASRHYLLLSSRCALALLLGISLWMLRPASWKRARAPRRG